MVAITAFGSSEVFGQFASSSGRIEMANTKVPVVGAVIEVYRTDIKAGSSPSKTGKKGEFRFAGLMLGATYVLSVSSPNCAPTYLPNVRAGQENLVITLDPGDGRKMSEAEVRKAVLDGAKANDAAGTGSKDTKSGGQTGELTEEGKKKKAEYDAQVVAIEAKNKKAVSNNELIGAALKAGNAAFESKNYDLAISKYDEGIAADPDFVGSAPILLNNRGAVLKDRGVDTYNKFAKSTDVTARLEAFKKVTKDFADSAESYNRAWTIAKQAPAAEIVDPKTNDASKILSIRGARETFRLAVLTEKVDPSVIDAAKILIPEYLIIETDAAKKTETNLILGDLYRVNGDSQNAIDAYKKILETLPDNLDALSGVGFSLVNLGYINNDKAQLQEGANFLQKFASAAPDTNKFKADAVGLIDTLKKEQNVAPQKVTTRKKN